jgi:hypothetical protein
MKYERKLEKRIQLYKEYKNLLNVKQSSYLKERSVKLTNGFKKYLKNFHNQDSYSLTLGKIIFARKKYKEYKKFMEACIEFHKYYINYKENGKVFDIKPDYGLNYIDRSNLCNNCGEEVTNEMVFCIQCKAVI